MHTFVYIGLVFMLVFLVSWYVYVQREADRKLRKQFTREEIKYREWLKNRDV